MWAHFFPFNGCLPTVCNCLDVLRNSFMETRPQLSWPTWSLTLLWSWTDYRGQSLGPAPLTGVCIYIYICQCRKSLCKRSSSSGKSTSRGQEMCWDVVNIWHHICLFVFLCVSTSLSSFSFISFLPHFHLHFRKSYRKLTKCSLNFELFCLWAFFSC